VDDIMLTSSDPVEIEHVKQHLYKCLGIKDLGQLHYFLGLEVSYIPKGLFCHKRNSLMISLKKVDSSTPD